MKNFLSIGDVSKMKGVSIKSLRYYEEIKILLPAYINQETGYRYYTINQMVLVDLIITCVELGIPLKNFSNYILQNQTIDIERIQKDGEKIAKQKILQLKKILKSMEILSEHLKETEEISKCSEVITKNIKSRRFFTTPLDADIFDIIAFWKKITVICRKCTDLGIEISINQGIIFLYKKQKVQTFAFIEVMQAPRNCQEIIKIPQGNYSCEVFKSTEITSLYEKYLNNKSYPDGTILICKELFDKKIETSPLPLEVQLLQ